MLHDVSFPVCLLIDANTLPYCMRNDLDVIGNGMGCMPVSYNRPPDTRTQIVRPDLRAETGNDGILNAALRLWQCTFGGRNPSPGKFCLKISLRFRFQYFRIRANLRSNNLSHLYTIHQYDAYILQVIGFIPS